MNPTAIIADDEPILAHSLEILLGKLWPELEILSVCHDGQTALNSLYAQQPDLAFLDINMPLLNGMDIAADINKQSEYQPLLVFITAYDQFAIDAFEQKALDYLLKPATEERLRKTITRLSQYLEERSATLNLSATNGHRETLATPCYRTQLSVNVGQKRLLLPVADVAYFQSDGKYTRAVGPNSDYLLNEPLKQLERELPPDSFWRIHRSTILNTHYIDYSTRTDTGRLEVFLKQVSDTLIVSRRYLHLFQTGTS